MKTFLTTISLILIALSLQAQTTPHKVIRVYNLNLRGNKVQEAQIKQSAKWPVLSVRVIGKNIIKYTFYTCEAIN